jgi:hypothetical protein
VLFKLFLIPHEHQLPSGGVRILHVCWHIFYCLLLNNTSSPLQEECSILNILPRRILLLYSLTVHIMLKKQTNCSVSP